MPEYPSQSTIDYIILLIYNINDRTLTKSPDINVRAFSYKVSTGGS
jgi:hypothetical protein